MNFTIPYFLCATVIFFAVISLKIKQHEKKQNQTIQSFFDRERLANSTRRKDISNLSYLAFSADNLPISECQDDGLKAQEAILLGLSDKKIINLSHFSNTDLKMMYGPANLAALSEYDDNYHVLTSALLEYAKRELSLERIPAAIAILEYAMQLRIESSQIYLLLDKLYQEHAPEKLPAVTHALSSMDSSFSSLVLPKLGSIPTKE